MLGCYDFLFMDLSLPFIWGVQYPVSEFVSNGRHLLQQSPRFNNLNWKSLQKLTHICFLIYSNIKLFS